MNGKGSGKGKGTCRKFVVSRGREGRGGGLFILSFKTE